MILAAHRRKKDVNLAFTRRLVRKFQLDLKRPRDVEFLQFEVLVFSELFAYIGRKAERRDRTMRTEDWIWLADKALKGRKAYQFWQGPTAGDTAQALSLLWKVCTMLVKNYR